ncbi:MAG: hypothetical protein KTR20_01970, partial [Cellvibrionaceae bacterium]|nr:hypothetical protein [Cellvibrionaceae bacterium]
KARGTSLVGLNERREQDAVSLISQRKIWVQLRFLGAVAHVGTLHHAPSALSDEKTVMAGAAMKDQQPLGLRLITLPRLEIALSENGISGLIDSQQSVFAALLELVETISVDVYTRVQQPYFESSLGKHIRHIIDHYLCFQRDYQQGLIDYDQRPRSAQLETDKVAATRALHALQEFLMCLHTAGLDDRPVQVILCSDAATACRCTTRSSLGRELQFLQSHSIHHQALIGVMLTMAGMDTHANFGVAPSTLYYEKTATVSSVKAR